ncbi:hypothetical protein KIPB_012840, partial [Kipferlia bialata]|eukprot:g12840.t1
MEVSATWEERISLSSVSVLAMSKSQDEEKNPELRSSLNIVNSLVGAGFLAVPYAYMEMGWIPAFIFAIVTFFIH